MQRKTVPLSVRDGLDKGLREPLKWLSIGHEKTRRSIVGKGVGKKLTACRFGE
jgi:hypothetical protein